MFSSKSVKIPETLKKVAEIFNRNGYSVYLVGGAVRDMIMGKGVHDYDLATDATPEQVMNIFHKVIPTGIQHGTVTVTFLACSLKLQLLEQNQITVTADIRTKLNMQEPLRKI